MKRLSCSVAALVIVLTAAGQARADIIPVSSHLNLWAESSAGAGTVTDTYFQSQGGTINPLAGSVRAIATNGTASVETTAVGSATWVNPGAGKVVLSDIGWTTANVFQGSADPRSGLDFSYTFTSEKAGWFALNYSVTGAGTDTHGLNRFTFEWLPHGFGVHSEFLNHGTSGKISKPLDAGKKYTLALYNFANISGQLRTRDAHMTGTFDFNITPAPEPTSLTLLTLGALGMAGYAWRRRSRARLTAGGTP